MACSSEMDMGGGEYYKLNVVLAIMTLFLMATSHRVTMQETFPDMESFIRQCFISHIIPNHMESFTTFYSWSYMQSIHIHYSHCPH